MDEQKAYMIENGIETQTSMPDSLQQNGQVERFQQTIVNGAEAMWHHAGLSNGDRKSTRLNSSHRR